MSKITMFDSIMLWDKVLSDEDKFAMVDNDWSISEDMRTNDRFVERVIQMNASSMCDEDLDVLHNAMILSPRTIFFMKKLYKLERKIKQVWNRLTFKTNKRGEALITNLGIFSYDCGIEMTGKTYDELGYMAKHVLRMSYNPETNHFVPQGVIKGHTINQLFIGSHE